MQCVSYIYSTSQFRLAIFQVLSCLLWLVATLLHSAVLDHEASTPGRESPKRRPNPLFLLFYLITISSQRSLDVAGHFLPGSFSDAAKLSQKRSVSWKRYSLLRNTEGQAVSHFEGTLCHSVLLESPRILCW